MKGLTTGRVVHYVLAPGDNVRADKVGQHRPALVVTVDGPRANLAVFYDGANDLTTDNNALAQGVMPALWRTSVEEDPAWGPGTFHAPEYVD